VLKWQYHYNGNLGGKFVRASACVCVWLASEH